MSSNNLSNSAPLTKTKIMRIKRDTPPAHFILKIKSFTQFVDILRKTGDSKYESDEFEAGDYKWKLVVYPNGNESGNGEGHISMYVASTDKNAISSGCHVNALVTFFVYDHIRDQYSTIQDGRNKHYHALKTEHGFDQLLSLVDFNDVSNGYLVNDCCALGAEVHVIKNTARVVEFSVLKDPPHATFTWKIDKFSTLQNEYYYSDSYDVVGHKWKLKLFPRGNSEYKDIRLALYLILDSNYSVNSIQRVYAECKILIKDQIQGKHHEKILDDDWFGSRSKGWGFSNLVLLSDLRDASKGFLVNDSLVVEVEFTLVSSVKDLSSQLV